MIKILITAIGGDIGYGIVKSLKHSDIQFYIFGCDIKKYNYSYDIIDSFHLAPCFLDEKMWIDFMLDILSKNEIKYFWPVSEPEIKIVNKNKSAFENCNIIINSPNIIDLCLDKLKTAQQLPKFGVHTPTTWADIPKRKVEFPLIVKERFGCGSHSVRVVYTQDELNIAFNSMTNPIIQTYVGDKSDEYTMAVFSDGIIINSIAFRRTLGLGGMSQYVDLVHDTSIYKIAETIAKNLSLRGSINVQMRKYNGVYYVFEINPRISSTMGFRLKLGFNDSAWWIDMLEGNNISKYTIPTKNVYGVRNVEEKLFYD